MAEPLLATHRLDTCTEGLVVLGRTAAFVSAFNRLQLAGAVQKFYRALTLGLPPQGAALPMECQHQTHSLIALCQLQKDEQRL
jgi:23S rRNA-/tRNA-specific pseudouridylate synthase